MCRIACSFVLFLIHVPWVIHTVLWSIRKHRRAMKTCT